MPAGVDSPLDSHEVRGRCGAWGASSAVDDTPCHARCRGADGIAHELKPPPSAHQREVSAILQLGPFFCRRRQLYRGRLYANDLTRYFVSSMLIVIARP